MEGPIGKFIITASPRLAALPTRAPCV